MHLLWLKMEYAEYRERTELRMGVLREMMHRLENGEMLERGVFERVIGSLDDDNEFEKCTLFASWTLRAVSVIGENNLKT